MSDDVRRWSEELARDPSSRVFLQLGEALRRQGQTAMALKVALRGLERHSQLADAHDLLARIAVDRGELQRAFDEWDIVLRLSPDNAGARKGMGFICFQQGKLAEAERHLSAAAAGDPADGSIASALAHVRESLRTQPSGPSQPVDTQRGSASRGGAQDARTLFANVIGEGYQTALLLDGDGLVLAGAYVAPDGRDVAQEVGAQLSGVSDEAQRAMRHLDLGDWSSIVFETDAAIVAMAPATGGRGLLLVAASRDTPLGFVRRLLDRVSDRARQWLTEGA